jgi:hypothetical protein
MRINNKGIFCFWCNKYYDPYLVFLHVLFDGSITCDCGHLLGYEHDIEWIELFG